VTDESQLQIRPKVVDSSLSLSKARSSLIARGRKDAAGLLQQPSLEAADPLTQLRQQAEAGDADAQVRLGVLQEVARDYAEATGWYRKAAEQGNAGAQCQLGLLYAAGKGVAQDYAEAVRWFRKAAEQGDFDANSELGRMYEKGEGVPADGAEALRYYFRAADIALEVLEGGVESDFSDPDGVTYVLERAAEHGHPKAKAFAVEWQKWRARLG
jgi:tetratricopeptide (TPR) repeat protein